MGGAFFVITRYTNWKLGLLRFDRKDGRFVFCIKCRRSMSLS